MTTPTPFSMASDHHFPAHPKILEALVQANQGVEPSYEGDKYSKEAKEQLKEMFSAHDALFVFNGTAANVLSLKLFLPPACAVICSEVSHLFLDEAGAPEALAGAKLLPAQSTHGKIAASAVLKLLHRQRDQHFAPVKMISITQPTELGTVYTAQEIKALREVCDDHNLVLHIDGARLAQGAHFLKADLGEAAPFADVISLGGTKNGLLFGETVVLRTPSPHGDHSSKIRKQLLNLPSKSRYLGAQMLAYFENGLWNEIAGHAHERALELNRGLEEMGFRALHPVESNAVFVSLPKDARKRLRKKYFFYVWDIERDIVRLMTSFHHSKEDIENFLQNLKQELNS